MDEDKSQLQDNLTSKTPKDSDSDPNLVEELKNELSEQKDKYLRLLAEMENARKRMQKEKHDTTRFAIENVILEFLTPLDNFENALSFAHNTSEETQTWAKGFEMILTQFKDILTNHQVTSFSSEGNPFDPHLHEVIEMEETEQHLAGTVIQEFVCGYKCGERILRPARVKVSKTKDEKEKASKNNSLKAEEGEK